MYAAGKIPGSFFKREGRAGEKGTLTARMIDRPLRPLFPKGWRRETQLVSIPMSVDHVNPYDILAMNGASAALMVSDIPFPAPVGAVRIGMDDERGFVVNPDEESLLETDARPGRRRHRGGHPDGRGRRQRGVRGRDPRRARHRARRDQRSSARRSASCRRSRARRRTRSRSRRSTRICSSEIRDRFGAALDEATQVEDKLERQDATKRVEEEVLRGLHPGARRRGLRRGVARARSSPSTSSRRTSSGGASPWTRSGPTAVAPTRSARSGSRSESLPARTGRRSSPAARRRPSPSPLSEPRARR